MSVVTNALSKLSEKENQGPRVIQKAVVPSIKKSGPPLLWIGVGVCVSLVIGGWAITSNSDEQLTVNRAEGQPPLVKTTAKVNAPTTLPPTQRKTNNDSDVQVYSAPTPVTKKTVEASSVKVASRSQVKPSVEKEVVKPTPVPVVAKSIPIKAKPVPVKAKVTTPKPVRTAQPAPVEMTQPILVAKATPSQPLEEQTMLVEQVELTPQQLANKALTRAEKAMESNDFRTAMQEYSRALRLVPTDERTRKKLSALYYGRHQTRQATELLQQGIKLNHDGEALRLALAKLLLREKHSEAALTTLTYLPSSASVDYLALRAGVAQQLKNTQIALQSYQHLVKHQPESGRWWLGLAIQQERSSDYKSAKNSYTNAMNKVGISSNSMDFIRQRLEFLNTMQENINGN